MSDQLKAIAVMLLVTAIPLASSLALDSGCKPLVAALPTAEKCVATILTLAAEGKTLPEIVAASAGCAEDVLVYVVNILLSSTDTKVVSSKAFRQASDQVAHWKKAIEAHHE